MNINSLERLLVCGDRNWTNPDSVILALTQLVRKFGPFTVIEGGARGADTFAGVGASRLGLPLEVYMADWDTHGKAAGPIRNRVMLNTGVDAVIGFHHDITASRGTRHMLRLAASRNVPTRLYNGVSWSTVVDDGCPDCEFLNSRRLAGRWTLCTYHAK